MVRRSELLSPLVVLVLAKVPQVAALTARDGDSG